MPLTRWRPLELVLLAAAMIGAWNLLMLHMHWYVDDAAISFAFARNLADGRGLVAYPGGERVEGYSNPLWVFLLAGFHTAGFQIFDVAKWLGGAMAIAAIPMIWMAGRRSHGGPWLGLAAAIAVATSAQVVIWSTSGLEPGLFIFALSGAIWRTIADHEDQTFPWAALWFLAVACTRPEGIAYAAIGGFWFLVMELRAGRGLRRVLWWLLVFWAPFLVYHGIRYWYFAWEFPATYYAKSGYVDRADTRGVKQLKEWAQATGHYYAVPIYVIGLIGTRPWRGIERWPLRGLVASLTLFGVFFSVYSGGDWMKGFRWMSLFAVPLATWYAIGLWDVASLFRRLGAWLPPVLVLGGLTAIAVPNVIFVTEQKPVAPPRSIKSRTDHYYALRDKIDYERLVVVDHDMGAMVWWGDHLGEILDTQGLVTVPFAVNRNKPHFRRFVTEWLFRNKGFDIAHTHGRTKQVLRRRNDFKRQFVEVDNYPPKRRSHNATFMRRSIFLPVRTDEKTLISFNDEVTLHQVELLAGMTAPTREAMFEVRVGVEPGMAGYRMLLFLAGPGELVMRDIPPAYDWVKVPDWRANEVFVGHFPVEIPKKAVVGDWDLGVVIFDAEGRVMTPTHVPEGAIVGEEGNARVAIGEVRFPKKVPVLAKAELNRRVDQHMKALRTLASEGDCQAAENRWNLARWAQKGLDRFVKNQRPGAAEAIATCWAQVAPELDNAEMVEAFERSRQWQWDNPTLAANRIRPVERRWSEAMAARRAGRHREAQDAFDDVLRMDPTKAWARRYLEQARWARMSD